MRVLGISGSLRADSLNSQLLALFAAQFPADVEFERYDRLREVPAFDQDLETGELPAAVAALKASLTAADGVVIATPEFNGSVPGALKNALDWASRPYDANPLRGKVAVVIGASSGRFGAAEAQADLRRILARIGARVVPIDLAIGKAAETLSTGGSDSPDAPDISETFAASLREPVGAFTSEISAGIAARQAVAA